MNRKLNPKKKTGSRLRQNQIKVQQLKNEQYILTLPRMWADILKLKKGTAVTFLPGKNGGVEIVKADEK